MLLTLRPASSDITTPLRISPRPSPRPAHYWCDHPALLTAARSSAVLLSGAESCGTPVCRHAAGRFRSALGSSIFPRSLTKELCDHLRTFWGFVFEDASNQVENRTGTFGGSVLRTLDAGSGLHFDTRLRTWPFFVVNPRGLASSPVKYFSSEPDSRTTDSRIGLQNRSPLAPPDPALRAKRLLSPGGHDVDCALRTPAPPGVFTASRFSTCHHRGIYLRTFTLW